MDCNEIRNRIDKWRMEDGERLPKKVFSHLDECEACNVYYEIHKKFNVLIANLRSQQPLLKDSDLFTDEILISIQHKKNKRVNRTIPLTTILTRGLAAAVVVLFITLGMEQYVVLQKVHHLEVQLDKINHLDIFEANQIYRTSLLDLEALSNNGKQLLNFRKLTLILKLNDNLNTNFTYQDLKRTITKDERLKTIIEEQQQKLKQ